MSADLVWTREGKHVFVHTAAGVPVKVMGYSEWLGIYFLVWADPDGFYDYDRPAMETFDRGKALRALHTGVCPCGQTVRLRTKHMCGDDVALYNELYTAKRAAEEEDRLVAETAVELHTPVPVTELAAMRAEVVRKPDAHLVLEFIDNVIPASPDPVLGAVLTLVSDYFVAIDDQVVTSS